MKRVRYYCGLTDREGNPVNPERYRAVIEEYYDGYSEYSATGVWKGKAEDTLVFEIILNTWEYYETVGEELTKVGNQECILETVEDIKTYFHAF